MSNVPIIEVGKVIQGEGKTAGQPRLLLRVNGCNLRCKYCDTSRSWTEQPILVDADLLKSALFSSGEWMITGGEPMLYIDEILKLIVEHQPTWTEIETCGVLLPNNVGIFHTVDLWNISPKRAEDQSIPGTDVTPYILKYHEQMRDFIIKIVVTPDLTIEELKATLANYEATYSIANINKRVWLMPMTSGSQFITDEKAWKMALELGVNYSDRNHIRIFGSKVGV